MIAARIVEEEGELLTVDPLANPGLLRELPGLAAAFDGDRMRAVIGEALAGAGSRIDGCRPGKALYLPGDSAIVRYQLRIGSEDRIVCGRVFPDPAASQRYVDERLTPLAARAAGRPETVSFSATVAHVEPLAMALSAFPVDGDLPMLVDATDPERMLAALSALVGGTFDRCQVDVVAYPRRGRCVLRYRLEPGNRTIYGKITAGGEGERTPALTRGLQPLLAVPRCLGYDEDLKLVLMDPMEGTPGISSLLRGEASPHGMALPELLQRAAVTGAVLHNSGCRLGADRTFQMEIRGLRDQLGAIRRHAPELGDRLDRGLDQAEELAAASVPRELGLAHGDFTHSQIVFDRQGRAGLLDFDDFCQAEPALDLGQFTAYLALGVAKSGAEATGLSEAFLAAYADAAGVDRKLLADRHAAYEICSFTRMASHAWHKLKGARLAHVLDAMSRSAVLAGLRRFSAPPAWLLAASDGGRVGEELARAVPELQSGASTLRSCAARRIRLKEDQCWRVEYEVVIDAPGGECRTVGLVGLLDPPGGEAPTLACGASELGSAGWRCSLPRLGLHLETRAEDADLPAVPLLTDPEPARVFLEAAIRHQHDEDLRIASCAPRVVRYKRGSRCTVVSTLSYERAEPGWPRLVVAKTYRADKGRNAYEAMRALWDSPLASGDVVAIAEPLAYLERERVLIQGPVDEELTLKELIREKLDEGAALTSGALAEALRQTAAGLAALHRCGVVYGEPVTLADELAEVRERAARLGAALPAVAGAAGPLLAAVSELADRFPADPLVPSHRSFRPAQVLLAGGRIAFIDFDGFCQAEPALDIALFRATLKSIGLATLAGRDAARRDQLRDLEILCDLFTDAYEARAPVSRQRVALWETLDLLTNVLNSWAKAKLHRLDGRLLALETHTRRLLEEL
ncbi:MAG: hypothetical protein ACRDZO_00775 [Egibacteraceae bacterium]